MRAEVMFIADARPTASGGINSQTHTERVYFGDDLRLLPVGKKADAIRIDVTFNGEDIDSIIRFLKGCKPCFK